MSQPHLQTLLTRLAEQLNIEGLQLDNTGYCLVTVDQKIDLSIEFNEETQSAIFTTLCGVLPAEGCESRAAILLELLDANYYWAGSGGATLSTNSDLGTVYLQFRESAAQLDQARLEEILQALLDGTDFWQSKLLAPAPVDTTEGAETEAAISAAAATESDALLQAFSRRV